MKNQFLEIGKVINKRGINGELKLESYCDGIDVLKGVKQIYTDINGNNSHELVSVKEYKGFLFIKLKDITTAELADDMRGKLLYASRDALNIKKGAIFLADIIGLSVFDADSGKEYGMVLDILNFGASDIYVISDGEKEYMLPDANGMVVEINTDSGIKVRPIKGIFDDAEEIR